MNLNLTRFTLICKSNVESAISDGIFTMEELEEYKQHVKISESNEQKELAIKLSFKNKDRVRAFIRQNPKITVGKEKNTYTALDFYADTTKYVTSNLKDLNSAENIDVRYITQTGVVMLDGYKTKNERNSISIDMGNENIDVFELLNLPNHKNVDRTSFNIISSLVDKYSKQTGEQQFILDATFNRAQQSYTYYFKRVANGIKKEIEAQNINDLIYKIRDSYFKQVVKLGEEFEATHQNNKTEEN